MHKVKIFTNKDLMELEKDVNSFLEGLSDVKEIKTSFMYLSEKEKFVVYLDIAFEDCVSFEFL